MRVVSLPGLLALGAILTQTLSAPVLPNDGNLTDSTTNVSPRNKDNCDCYYWFEGISANFEIYGNFRPDRVISLTDGLIACGGYYNQKYVKISNGPHGFTWKLSGWNMVGGQKSCVGNVLVENGGSTRGACWGPG